ncbi:MAG: response regulator transcription factor [Rhizonema sp. PD38]|nr:response regulator transcription factor [Rhizonema sp. PD38]
MSTLRILLVDDSYVFLRSITRFLAIDARLEIVGCVLSAEEAIHSILRSRPDLVLMDLSMGRINGLEATRVIKAQPNPPYVVILTLNASSEYCAASVAVGADGFVAKSEIGTALLPLIQGFI